MTEDPRQPIDLTLDGTEEITDLMDEKDLQDLLVEPDIDPDDFLLDGDVPITLPG